MNIHVFMNDDSFVSGWQDGSMTDVDEQPGTREVDSVEVLRALADPVRLAILAALNTRDADGKLPVMAVKELASQLAEPPTKLYRHVKQLEAADLIEVAATRLVSGIQEQRYRSRQHDLRLSPALYRRHTDESEAAIRSAFDVFLASFFDQAAKASFDADAPDRPILLVAEEQVSPAAAERIRARLTDLTKEIADSEPGDVPVSVALGFFRSRGPDR